METDQIDDWEYTALHLAGVGICKYLSTGEIIYINDCAFTILVLQEQFESPQQIVGEKINDVVQFAQTYLINSLNQSSNQECSFITKKGEEKWITHQSFKVFDKQINDTIIIDCIKDISNKKQDESKISFLTKQWEGIFDSLSDAICIINTEYEILFCNKHMLQLFEISKTKTIGEFCWKIIHKSSEPHYDCPIQRVKESKLRETMLFQLNSKWLEVIVDPILDSSNNIQSYVHLIRDVTKQKKLEQYLRLSEEKYKTLSEITSDSATSSLVYPDGRLEREWVIEKLFLEYGYTPEDLDTLTKWRSIIHPDDIGIFDQNMQKVGQGESM